VSADEHVAGIRDLPQDGSGDALGKHAGMMGV